MEDIEKLVDTYALARELGVHIGNVYVLPNRKQPFWRVRALEYEERGGIGYKHRVQFDVSSNGIDWKQSDDFISLEMWESQNAARLVGDLEDIVRHGTGIAHNLRDAYDDNTGIEPGTDIQSANADRLRDLQESTAINIARVKVAEGIIRAKAEALLTQMNAMRAQMSSINRVIHAINSYLGIDQEVVVLKIGTPANEKEPVHIHQLVLNMDEEAGLWRNGGIDFRKVDDFDQWVISGDNLRTILPFAKSIVAIRPTQRHIDYGDALTNAWAKTNNKMCYLLCRNGDNVYRIWLDLALWNRFVPGKKEIEHVYEQAEQYNHVKAEDTLYYYKRNALLVQGIFDHTDIFKPCSEVLSVFGSSNVQFVFDGEMALPTGRLPYWIWIKEVNSHITVGSRVYINPPFMTNDTKLWYFTRYYRNGYNAPANPKSGVYTVDSITTASCRLTQKEQCVIYYQPGGSVYTDWYENTKERERRVGWMFSRDEHWVINYDGISLEDLEFYINARSEREHFLDVLPLIEKLRIQRLGEISLEKDFVSLVANRMGVEEARVWDAVEWWKTKNKWHRPLAQDDAKALRMIEKRLKKQEEV